MPFSNQDAPSDSNVLPIQQKMQAIQWIVSDVDGVLTDGGIIYDGLGMESKKFHVRDGLGIKLWKMAGGKFGILTERKSEAVSRRAGELKADFLSQGNENKWKQACDFFQANKIDLSTVCYVGDDLTDFPVLQQVGLSVCVSDAAEELMEFCDLITDRPGGYGAVREVVERILQNQGKWQATIDQYKLECVS